MKTIKEIKDEIQRLKKKEEGNKAFLQYGGKDCENNQLIRKHNYTIRKQIKMLEWVLN